MINVKENNESCSVTNYFQKSGTVHEFQVSIMDRSKFLMIGRAIWKLLSLSKDWSILMLSLSFQSNARVKKEKKEVFHIYIKQQVLTQYLGRRSLHQYQLLLFLINLIQKPLVSVRTRCQAEPSLAVRCALKTQAPEFQ